MKCPVCGAAELIHDTRDETYTYKGESTVIPAVTGDFCPACDESLLDPAETERVMREMRAFTQQVNAAFVAPGYITEVRKKLANPSPTWGEGFFNRRIAHSGAFKFPPKTDNAPLGATW